jgi:hypothetical protein
MNFFNLPNPSNRTMTLGSTQPQIEMSTRNLSAGIKSSWQVGLTTLLPSVSRMSENVGAPTSRNPKVLHSLYRDNFTFYPQNSTWVIISESFLHCLHHFFFNHILPVHWTIYYASGVITNKLSCSNSEHSVCSSI